MLGSVIKGKMCGEVMVVKERSSGDEKWNGEKKKKKKMKVTKNLEKSVKDERKW